MRVLGGRGVGPRASASGRLRARACGHGARVGSEPVQALPVALGVYRTVCVHARVCVAGPPGVYLRMLWAVFVPAAGAGRRPAPAQSLLHGDVFQTGFLRRLALLQPELEGERRPHRPPGTRAAWGLQTDT